MMMLLFVITALSQADALFTGTVPAEIPTFSVSISGSEPFYAAMRVGGEWIKDRNQEIKSNQEVEFVPDIPWRTGEVVRSPMRRAEINYEAPAMRRERLTNTWKSMGYVMMETAAGWSPVKEADIQLAERAQTMAAQLDQKLNPVANTSPGVASVAAGEETGSGALSTAAFWGLRAVILVVGLAASGALFYRFRNN